MHVVSRFKDNVTALTLYRRKPQQRKHKSWDGDGVLIVNGKKAVLKDKDTGNTIASGTIKYESLESGTELSFGGKDIEVKRPLPILDLTDLRLD